jgi:hypothetical protein
MSGAEEKRGKGVGSRKNGEPRRQETESMRMNHAPHRSVLIALYLQLSGSHRPLKTSPSRS